MLLLGPFLDGSSQAQLCSSALKTVVSGVPWTRKKLNCWILDWFSAVGCDTLSRIDNQRKQTLLP